MPVDLPAAIETAIQHLQEGALQAANDLLVQTLSDYRAQLETIGLSLPPTPKGTYELGIQWATSVCMRFGNPPDLCELLDQIKQSVPE